MISRCEPFGRASLIRELLADENLTGAVREHALISQCRLSTLRRSGEGDYEPIDALRMMFDLVRLGQDDALTDVRPRLTAAIVAQETGPPGVHFQDYVIGNAVELLQDWREPLTLTELGEIARSLTDNMRFSGLRATA